jgi:hypothetical protein
MSGKPTGWLLPPRSSKAGKPTLPLVVRLAVRDQLGSGGQAASLPAAVAAHHLLLSGDGDIHTSHRLLVGAIEAQPPPYTP